MSDEKPTYDVHGAARILAIAEENRGWPPKEETVNRRQVAAEALLDAVEAAAPKTGEISFAKPKRGDRNELLLAGSRRGGAQTRVTVVLTADHRVGATMAVVAGGGLQNVPVQLPTLDFDPIEGKFVGRTDAAIVLADAIAKAIFGEP